ncbi:MAG: ABC transporter permease [Gammaproteobacteria bacterium]
MSRSRAWLAVLLTGLSLAGLTTLADDAAERIDLDRILEPPSWKAPLGFDDLGRPLGARIAVGAQTAVLVAATVVMLSATLGTLLGMLAGWCGGWIELLIVRLIDVFMAVPGILLAIALAGILGPGLDNVVIALSAVGWVGFARLARAQTRSLRRRDHVLVAHALGTPVPRILRLHVLPLISGPLIVEATFALAAVIVAEAGLSFLGLGVQPPTPSWGGLIRDGTRYLLIAPHLVIMPGLALMTLVIAINLAGDRARDRWAGRAL